MIDQRSKVLDSIRRTLIAFVDNVQLSASTGIGDINKATELFFCDLLNTMYGYDLTNANQIRSNYPAVDLIDEKSGVGVQITSTNSRLKAKITLEKFLEHHFQTESPTLIFLVSAFVPPFKNAAPLIREARDQGVDFRIITLLDIYHEIVQKPFDKIIAISSCLDKHIGLVKSADSEADIDFESPTVIPAELSDICLQVLRLASILPREGLRRKVFEYGLCLEQRKAVDDLVDYKLLKEKGDVLFIHPFYRNSKDFTPSPAECHRFLDDLWHYERSWDWDKVLWRGKTAVCRSLAQIFSTAATLFPESSTVYAHRSAELWRSTTQYQNALRQEQIALRNLESVNKNSLDVARARHFTGECHYALQEHEPARSDWKFVLDFCQNSPDVSISDLVRALLNLGRALLKLNEYLEYHSAEIHLLSALNLIEMLRKDADHLSLQLWHKDTYDALATLYTMLGLGQKASTCTQNTQGFPDKQDLLWEDLYSKRHILLEDLSPTSALSSNAFVGREEELAEIEKRFETERIVILSGLGGTGKTELAIRYGSEYETSGKGMVYFVRFQTSFIQTVVHEISRGIPDYRFEGKSEDQIYKDTMAALERCWKNDLLILDNADLADFPVLRRELSALPLRILITTRQDLPKAIHVKGLDRSSLYAIFQQYEVDITQKEMDALIDAVDGHTLTIDLMARTMRPDRRNATTAQWLTALQSYNLTDVFAKVSTNYQHSPAQTRINEHLRAVFRVAELSELERELLRCATLLPPEGIDEEMFLTSFADSYDVDAALDYLIDKGWLQFNGGMLCIHPVIRIVCIAELQPTDASCDAFLEGVREQYDPNRYDHVQYTQMAALFTMASTVLEDREGFWANVAGHLWNELSAPQKALDCNLRSVEKSEMHQPDSVNLASAYNNVGYTYGILGNHEKALEYKLKALSIREMVFPADHPDFAQFYDSVGSTYSDLGDHEKARKYKLKALEIREKVLPADHLDLAQSYNNVGSTYGDLGDHEKARKYKLKALAIQEQVLPREHPALATSYNNVGSTYRDMSNYAKALEYQLKALEIRERVLPPVHPDLAQSYSGIGNIYNDLGDYRKGLEYSQKALEIFKRVLPENHPHIAYAYINTGHSYGYLGDYEKALAYLEKALAISEKALPNAHPLLKNIRKDIKQYRAIRNMVSHGCTTDTPAASIFSDK